MAGASEDATSKWFRTILILLATGGGGFGVSQGIDLFNAKAWHDQNVENLMEFERVKDKLLQCNAKVDAYEAQNAMLIDLVNRLDQRRGGRAQPADPSVYDIPRIE